MSMNRFEIEELDTTLASYSGHPDDGIDSGNEIDADSDEVSPLVDQRVLSELHAIDAVNPREHFDKRGLAGQRCVRGVGERGLAGEGPFGGPGLRGQVGEQRGVPRRGGDGFAAGCGVHGLLLLCP